MIIPLAALVILSLYATLEYFWGERRKCWSSYITWFFVILGSMYFAKAYGYEDYEVACYHAPIKFVPEGTPSNYINDDNTLSEACLEIVRSTDRDIAKMSFILHRDKGRKFYKQGEQGCWFMPTLKQREKAKMAFSTAIAAVPGPLSIRLVAATLSLLGQYGICCIDEYYNIEENLKMASYHFRLADAFHDHIQKNGW
jgi:hypothetical protein